MLSLTSLEKIVFYWLKTTIPAGRVGWSGRVVGSGGRVGWLDNREIMLNSVQLSWKLTELGNFSPQTTLEVGEIYYSCGRVVGSGRVVGVVGWLDNLGIRLNSAPTGVEFSWSWD